MNLQHLNLMPIDSKFGRATVEDIRQIEALLGAKLPEQLSRFLKEHGGAASPLGDAQTMACDGTQCGIFTLFQAVGERNSIAKDVALHPDYLVNGWVPIGDDLFNNRYVVDLQNGKVMFLEYGSGNVRRLEVADSFESFLASITVEPD
jgi:cell wall assembly regulator SMI1